VNFQDVLNEAKQVGDLYHFTDIQSLENILKKNLMSTGVRGFISFTRSKHGVISKIGRSKNTFVNPYGTFRISIDGNKMSNNNKIKPFSYSGTMGFYDKPNFDNMEERVMKDIKNIKQYIKEIKFVSKRKMNEFDQKLYEKLKKLYPNIRMI